MRAQEAEAKFQADRADKIARLVAEGYGPQRISELMSADLDSISEALNRRKSKRRQGPADKP
jgi:hypothetical protein